MFDLNLLRCPNTQSRLRSVGEGRALENEKGQKFNIIRSNIISLLPEKLSKNSTSQMGLYESMVDSYFDNLESSYTKEYVKYLDDLFLELAQGMILDNVLELCSGRGEAIRLFSNRNLKNVYLLDISLKMLQQGACEFKREDFTFIQGDATCLPIADNSIDTILIFGGIHHVKDRVKLYGEVFRVLKPGGKILFREPVDDFFLWRWVRNIIYKFSPLLDEHTEEPLRRRSTEKQLKEAGLRLLDWKTGGFLGFCLFMNSDVLIVNRVFKFFPGIRGIVRFFVVLDRFILHLPGTRNWGTQVMGLAVKQSTEELYSGDSK